MDRDDASKKPRVMTAAEWMKSIGEELDLEAAAVESRLEPEFERLAWIEAAGAGLRHFLRSRPPYAAADCAAEAADLLLERYRRRFSGGAR